MDRRDLTARAIYLENLYGRGSPHGGAYLAVNHLPENLIDDWIKREKPGYMGKLEKMGIDIRRHALECGPASHYSMGGIRVDERCETGLGRLYAAGEVAAGMDGAERIDGGPAITWCLTMGYIAGKTAAAEAKTADWPEIDEAYVRAQQESLHALQDSRQGLKGFEVKKAIKEIMWSNCALVRSGDGLEQGLREMLRVRHEMLPRLCVPDASHSLNKGMVEALEARNMVEVSEMILRAALMRQESRRAHYRTVFPQFDGKWTRNIVIKKQPDGMSLRPTPPVVTRIKPPGEEVGVE